MRERGREGKCNEPAPGTYYSSSFKHTHHSLLCSIFFIRDVRNLSSSHFSAKRGTAPHAHHFSSLLTLFFLFFNVPVLQKLCDSELLLRCCGHTCEFFLMRQWRSYFVVSPLLFSLLPFRFFLLAFIA